MADQDRFIQSQINEIRRYVEQYPNENPNKVVLRWIEERASKYRENWEENNHH
ncbi:MAG: hypothetical protein HQM13_10625 [SAR324 cluster bacterium]|nr:hypothetical protein [SAR324 cluster bacterium]